MKKKVKSKKNNKVRRFFKILLWGILIYVSISIFLTLIYTFVNPPVTILMIQRTIEQTFSKNREVRLKKDWVDIKDISPQMIRAVVAAEDCNFTKHNGFDFSAIKRAQKDAERRNKAPRGASTITQQMCKNVFLWNHRSYFRKGLEAYYTVLTEFIWSKERIMEVYLNVIEFGDGIYGVEAASQYYFGKSAKRLTKREAAMLAATLPSPLKKNPKQKTSYYNSRVSLIIHRMDAIGAVRF
ncbi:MAG: monofunctional biosynthetic peptidoglycan transglycosylase [Bacteroidales bacterium]|jgi:monofunctional biosynthetic peptidoglycan transglycosylase|nr:monofunctional biosynthetic peptidoglycan transglycosylase [Bacteroidales bacterium]